MQAATLIDFPKPVDRSGFTQLLREHHRGLVAYATALASSEHTARDIVQDASLAAWQSLARFEANRDFGTWMRGIVRNKWREYCRAHAREVAVDDETLARLEEPFRENPGDDALFARLAECRGKLPEAMEEAIRLTYDEGRSSDEAAEQTSASSATIRKRLERAREALRDCLSKKI